MELDEAQSRKPSIKVNGPTPFNDPDKSLQLQRATVVHGVPPGMKLDSGPHSIKSMSHSTRCSMAMKVEKGRCCSPSDWRQFVYAPQVKYTGPTSEERRVEGIKKKAKLVTKDPGNPGAPTNWGGSVKIICSTVGAILLVYLAVRLVKG